MSSGAIAATAIRPSPPYAGIWRVRIALLCLAATIACAVPATPSLSPSLSERDSQAETVARRSAEQLLGTDVRLVYRQSGATLRLIYREQGGASADDPGLFTVYASPSTGLFAEVFVRYEGFAITFSRATNDPVRR